MRHRLRSRLLALIVVAALAAAGLVVARPYVRSAALIAAAAHLRGPWIQRFLELEGREVTAEPLEVPARYGSIRARAYVPAGFGGRALVLSAGINPRGLDEPRLADFARAIAGRGIAVVTPEFADLTDFRVTPRLTDQIEDVARWVASQARFARDGRVGLMGISFSGGLSIVAAGRASIRDRAAYVVSLGGHGDLPRALRVLGTAHLADGTPHEVHDYGVIVLLHNLADALVPPEQATALREGTRTFLLASTIYMTDQAAGLRMFAHAREIELRLPQPARTLMHAVNTRDTAFLGPRLLPHLPAIASDPALSPERSRPPDAPVHLLHGADDTVIPAAETLALEAWLRSRGVRVRRLITPLLSHADVTPNPAPGDLWRLIRFWADVVDR